MTSPPLSLRSPDSEFVVTDLGDSFPEQTTSGEETTRSAFDSILYPNWQRKSIIFDSIAC